MSDPLTCKHQKFFAEVKVLGDVVQGVEEFRLTARVQCRQCKHWFVFPHGGDKITIPIAPAMPVKSAMAQAVEDTGRKLH